MRFLAVALACTMMVSAPLSGGGPGNKTRVVAVEPAPRSITASVNTPIVVHFDRPVAPASITTDATIRAFGRWSGAVTGSYEFADGDRTVALIPDRSFSAGEAVTVVLADTIEGADGTTIRGAGYSFQFWTRARPASMTFTEVDRLSTRTVPSQPTQAYGGIASDLDADGHLDITIVNEITADLRVFMNMADGTGRFFDFIQPTFPVGARASPSEPSDFNRDGVVDVCVANIDDDSVSILLGNGDGTFAPGQLIPVGDAPRGIAVLDADGDGDMDVANTNSGAGSGALSISLMLNDGSGVFGPPSFFDFGIPGAWALAAADMNGDGILDLVTGARFAEQIRVLAGRGNATFTALAPQNAGGEVWMLVCGDVDGDGDEDVSAINSLDNNGAILLGDGAGSLGSPDVYPVDPFALATDLGDLDGDGDLDWVTSSFNGDWRIYSNDGDGTFTFNQELPATSASSCSLALDIDNDRDLDLALIDEIADELILMHNDGVTPPVAPPRVPAGDLGTMPLTAIRLVPDGTTLEIGWDSTACPAEDYQILYGGGSDLPSAPGGTFEVAGSRCGIGSASPFTWLGAPSAVDSTGLVWFLAVANDTVGREGSWGADGAGEERNGPGPGGSSGTCHVTARDLSSVCE